VIDTHTRDGAILVVVRKSWMWNHHSSVPHLSHNLRGARIAATHWYMFFYRIIILSDKCQLSLLVCWLILLLYLTQPAGHARGEYPPEATTIFGR